jgi:transcriptional regulatory protein RtcR
MAADATDRLDRFERVQLEDVLQVCRESATLSAAGRVLFERSRERRKLANDADRLRTYLARLGLDWAEVKEKLRLTPY